MTAMQLTVVGPSCGGKQIKATIEKASENEPEGILGYTEDKVVSNETLREDHTHLVVAESDFVQPYGALRGRVTFHVDGVDVDVDNAFGVVEDQSLRRVVVNGSSESE
ncbi:hypothetical protein ATCC90586_000066 [Pythium insidiosum]|nr:hypothetical protein ATCC90586_000066 [Pythium insidiosum]